MAAVTLRIRSTSVQIISSRNLHKGMVEQNESSLAAGLDASLTFVVAQVTRVPQVKQA